MYALGVVKPAKCVLKNFQYKLKSVSAFVNGYELAFLYLKNANVEQIGKMSN